MLRFDTRGHGQSGAPGGAYSLEQLAEDFHALLRGLGIERTHFVGLSMGGMIGQVFALKYPEMVQSLVLCDTTSRYPAAAAPVWQDRIKTVEAKGMEPLVEPTLGPWFTAPFRARRQELMAQVGQMIRDAPAQGYVGCWHDSRSTSPIGSAPSPVRRWSSWARRIRARRWRWRAISMPPCRPGGARHPPLRLASLQS